MFQRVISRVTGVLLAVTLATQAFALGESAPDFSLRALDGSMVRLSEQTTAGKVVLVNFWATWCGPCQVEMPHLQRMYTKYADVGLVVLSITIDDAKSATQVKPLVKRNGFTFPVLQDLDSKVVTSFNPQKTLPYTLIVDRQGRIVHVRTGYNAGDEVELEAKVREHLGLAAE